MPLPEQRLTVFGLGWSGVAAANLAASLGKEVTATDTRDQDSLQEALDALERAHDISLDPRVTVRCGQAHDAAGAQAVILTQSVKPWQDPVQRALAAGIPVYPEVELASRAIAAQGLTLVAFGGTDGKTTTVKLAHHLAQTARRAWIGGNSWTPLSARLLEIQRELKAKPLEEGQTGVLIAEISAFQLPPWHGFRPQVGALTNVAEDHVEEYFRGKLEDYIAAKRALVDKLQPGDLAVLNMDDRRVQAWEPGLRQRGVRVLGTSLCARRVQDMPDAAYRHNGQLRLRWEGHETAFIHQRDFSLLGDHNVENALTALGALAPLNLPAEGLREALRSFEAPHHRLEHVATWNGVDIYDDSKATNVHAAMAGLSAFGDKPLVLIVGGVDKGLEMDTWLEALRTRARAVIVIGELRARLQPFADKLPGHRDADSLEEAVQFAMDAAQAGDALVLSPACSSFDMFTGYAQRGQQFQAMIKKRLV